NGDIRYALDLLSYAGNLAESEGTERILLEQIKKINRQIYNGITDEDIKDLKNNEIIVLLAMVRGLKIKNRDYIDLKEIRIQTLEILEKYKLRKIDIENTLDELVEKKIIKILSLKKISLITASLDTLENILSGKIESSGFDSK
ncbi:MAG TPA: hypothetical protein VFV86_11700, partial [Nitrososphaeraceae archaeon]|nr:hypothetical protein [Nitrososphaeraceae archaeon]